MAGKPPQHLKEVLGREMGKGVPQHDHGVESPDQPDSPSIGQQERRGRAAGVGAPPGLVNHVGVGVNPDVSSSTTLVQPSQRTASATQVKQGTTEVASVVAKDLS
jgi:hypothetical protein